MRTISALFLACSLLFSGSALAAGESVKLPEPDKKGGMPLMQALAERHSTRAFSPEALDETTLGNLLWAAWGKNRPDGKRTSPSALNKQQLELYVNKADCVWQYDAGNHALVRVADAPLGKPLNDAPVVLIFAVPENDPCGGMHVGSVYQNVGLFCASAGLANVVKASTTRDQSLFSFLPGGWKAQATQSVGRPRQSK